MSAAPTPQAEPKQVIVLRTDLNMRKGKMVAQGSHASMGVILGLMRAIDGGRFLKIEPGTPLQHWLDVRFKKICVGIDGEAALLALHRSAQERGLPCCLIQDSGLTEFGGVPTYTALAIGPDAPDVIDRLTGTLKLL